MVCIVAPAGRLRDRAADALPSTCQSTGLAVWSDELSWDHVPVASIQYSASARGRGVSRYSDAHGCTDVGCRRDHGPLRMLLLIESPASLGPAGWIRDRHTLHRQCNIQCNDVSF